MKHHTKINRALEHYNGWRGAESIKSMLSFIPPCCFAKLTSAELGEVCNAINAAHQFGRKLEASEWQEICTAVKEDNTITQ